MARQDVALPTMQSDSEGTLWPSSRYYRLVEDLRSRIGQSLYVSFVSFNGAFRKEGQPYRLLDIISYPAPRAHPHPPKRAYPHLLVLESVPPEGQTDIQWRSGSFHGGAVNLAHLGSISTRPFPRDRSEFVYANLDLLSAYYARPASDLLERGIVPAEVCVVSPLEKKLDLASPHSLGKAALYSPR
ncbi:hypothetical protein LRB11_06640 [Ectothiorhodospira haloalkaliphila]|uniref:hypothetical protein n=2 Tax=Ectothiorhodospira TaxID=1051 RepID=UPI001EE939DF|nr:hypothetical protein [Ectothiorhodospira haloalkaliphila]MCG5524606.1 hypothetical protein [Ectothiorhodospira haloalkaliphila]